MDAKFGPTQARQLEKLWRKMQHMRISGPNVRVTNTDETFTCYIDPPPPQTPLTKITAQGLVILSIGAPGSRGAMYNVTALNPPTSDILTTGSTPVASTELGTAGATGMGINILEIADGTNNLASGSIGIGSLLHTNSDGTLIYEFMAIAGISCSGASA